MIPIPAIDLMDGKAVRLRAGRRDDVTVYSDAPWELAAGFARAGARRLHLVDLDGAFAGARRQLELVQRVVAAAGVPVQVGGGVRSQRDADELLDAGAAFVVLGTAAVKQPSLVAWLCARHPDQVIVAVDARDGQVAIEGWTESGGVDAVTLAQRAASWGAAKILYTDVARDGLGGGPNVHMTAQLATALGAATPVIASGGIGTLDHVRALAAAGIAECVIGRALYDGAFTLEEALAAC
jgi:phosphoribosylformimino-5-aminoimidazole carboxamide ribotide isomerase